MSVIDIINLSFGYNEEKVLDNINLKIEKDDFLAIIGPNGGGKSTLLKLILGILKPQSGAIDFIDDSMTIGYVPQNTNINMDFPVTAIEVVLMGHSYTKRPIFGYGKYETACAMEALREVGMEEYAKHRIGSLSGGQRQRVMIARALCSHPSVVILDEPTSSIDASGQKQIYDLLKELNKTMTIIVVSHDISITMEYANKVAYINKTIAFHDMTEAKSRFSLHPQGHFCEVELLQLLGKRS
ncbi:MAG: ABC transporter ATP-binding protein [Campylobacterales bacterium]|nr:ABC transporter ATP-binding protein [Campylobacterales bacterium]